MRLIVWSNVVKKAAKVLNMAFRKARKACLRFVWILACLIPSTLWNPTSYLKIKWLGHEEGVQKVECLGLSRIGMKFVR